MRKNLFIALFMVLASSLTAQEAAKWLRYPSISPDGTTLAFCYKGDIYTVPAQGGKATQLTTHAAYDYQPVWSPDGKTLAFASNRYGNFDIYTVSSQGGTPVRLTYWSGGEIPMAFSNDGSQIYYSSMLVTDATYSQFPNAGMEQVYSIPATGGRPALVTPICMESIDFNADGSKMAYYDKKGVEDHWRKHHRSSVTRDVWVYDLQDETYTQISDFTGENRDPRFVPGDDNSIYYLRECAENPANETFNGSFNVYKRNLTTGQEQQITFHENHPVRFLTVADNGLMAYSFNGELYTVREGEQPAKLEVAIYSDQTEPDYRVDFYSGNVSDMAVSPSGKEVAFVLRGDVYVTSTDYETTIRLTHTADQERNIDFSPDGKKVVYASERGGCWNLYMSEIADGSEQFVYANDIRETQLTEGNVVRFQPAFSPDGKEIAFLEDRTTLRVMNLDTKEMRTVLSGEYNYSYSDGDQWYAWAPDGQWLAVQFFEKGGWNKEDVALVKADGSGEWVNLTESGYSEGGGRWVLDGNALMWYSDRAGYRSHGSWGATTDIYLVFMNRQAYDKFLMNKEEAALFKEQEKKEKEAQEKEKSDKEDKKKDKKNKKDKKDEAPKSELPKIDYELEGIQDRIVRLTVASASHGDAFLSKDGNKLYYFAAFESGYDLWVRDFKDHSTRLLSKGTGSGAFATNKDGSKVFLLNRGRLNTIDLNSGKIEPIKMSAEYYYRPAEERAYMFDHACKQVVDKFYDPAIHGIDWTMYCDNYRQFLPYINNNYDFAEMLSELLGELNASHTGSGYRAYLPGDATATLGMFYDPDYQGDGLKVLEILDQNPVVPASSKIKPGTLITHIDGNAILAGQDYFRFLNHKTGKRVRLTLSDGKNTWEEWVKPISNGAERNMLYKRWVKQREELVAELSGGKIAYVHVSGMDSPSFRNVYSKLLGKYRNCDAVIVDTRFNGGGWLHDDLATLLNGVHYADMAPRGQYVASEPLNKWYKPSCVLVGEGNYSDAHGFPFSYKALNIGKLVGMPVPGTMTAVWWETQIDPSLYFGIPQVGFANLEGQYQENQQLNPDIEVMNTPASLVEGRDLQIEAAVKHLLEEIQK